MTPYIDHGDITVYVGDCLDVLRSLPDGCVDCCVTSPPYWGLRDYGTGSWDGGDPDCDHKQGRDGAGRADGIVDDRSQRNRDGAAALTRSECRCGATRVDRQLGLEASPVAYVAAMVAVFGEVRRVLADHGTCWINLGDSYAGSPAGNKGERRIGDGGQIFENKPFDTSKVPGLKAKDLTGIPWRVAFALQADGWYLRSDIIWAKPNPMPESVTDRPTKAHEYVFLLSKGPRYFFDQEAVREPAVYPGEQLGVVRGTKRRASANGRGAEASGNESLARSYALDAVVPEGGRNVRSVWSIATQPYADAHFATFPEELPRRCILAGCPEGGTVLDPFFGSGTTGLVARKHGRRTIGIELNEDYCALAARRLQQLSLLAQGG